MDEHKHMIFIPLVLSIAIPQKIEKLPPSYTPLHWHLYKDGGAFTYITNNMPMLNVCITKLFNDVYIINIGILFVLSV